MSRSHAGRGTNIHSTSRRSQLSHKKKRKGNHPLSKGGAKK